MVALNETAHQEADEYEGAELERAVAIPTALAPIAARENQSPQPQANQDRDHQDGQRSGRPLLQAWRAAPGSKHFKVHGPPVERSGADVERTVDKIAFPSRLIIESHRRLMLRVHRRKLGLRQTRGSEQRGPIRLRPGGARFLQQWRDHV